MLKQNFLLYNVIFNMFSLKIQHSNDFIAQMFEKYENQSFFYKIVMKNPHQQLPTT